MGLGPNRRRSVINENMKATELRIGNKVLYKNGIIDVIIISGISYSFGKYDVTINPNRKWIMVDIKTISPIPLTEEWLLKFGFESLLSGAGYVKNRTEIGYNHNGFYIITSGLKIEYVHQLQNLYFALTGEELTGSNM
jgi:hypothetical protein